MAVESARDCGACIARHVARIRVQGDEWHAEERDRLTGEWIPITEALTKEEPHVHHCAAVGSLLYAIGGGPDCVEVLDTVSGTWSTAAPMPTTRLDHHCAAVGSLLYLVGGACCE